MHCSLFLSSYYNSFKLGAGFTAMEELQLNESTVILYIIESLAALDEKLFFADVFKKCSTAKQCFEWTKFKHPHIMHTVIV